MKSDSSLVICRECQRTSLLLSDTEAYRSTMAACPFCQQSAECLYTGLEVKGGVITKFRFRGAHIDGHGRCITIEGGDISAYVVMPGGHGRYFHLSELLHGIEE